MGRCRGLKKHRGEIIVLKRLLNYVLPDASEPVFDIKRNQILTEEDSGYLEHIVDDELALMKEIQKIEAEVEELDA